MAGRRSNRGSDNSLPMLGNELESLPAGENEAALLSRIAELEEALALSKERVAALESKPEAQAAAEEQISGWPDVVVIPREFCQNHLSDLSVNPHAARAALVLEGTLLVRGPDDTVVARVPAGGYVLLAKGQPHALATGDETVRAVFVETPDYALNLIPFAPSVPVAAVPHAAVSSWQNAGATSAQAPTTAALAALPVPPTAIDQPSRAVMQAMEIQSRRGRHGQRVRHPNEPSMPVPAPQTHAEVANGGRHPSGAPLPIADQRAMVSSGDLMVQ